MSKADQKQHRIISVKNHVMELAEPLAKKNKDIEIKIEKETGKKTKKKKSRGKKKKPDSSDDDHGICMDSYDVEDSSDADYSKRRTKKKNVVSKKKKNDANESDVSEKKKKKRKKKRIVVESDEDIDSNSLGSDDQNNQNSDDDRCVRKSCMLWKVLSTRVCKQKRKNYSIMLNGPLMKDTAVVTRGLIMIS